jgi:dethiobiotin synthetase
VVQLFVTGTDTGVGKTFVSGAVLREARRRQMRAIGYKPLETGCQPVAEDARALGEASGVRIEPMHALAFPAAPSVAARRAGVEIDLEAVVARAKEVIAGYEVAIVEGAGGWRVPITERAEMGDLAAGLGLPVLIVARGGLGTINHTLLTIDAVAARCVVWGVVLSVLPTDEREFAESNREEIAKRTAVPVWTDPLRVLDQDRAGLGAEGVGVTNHRRR